MGDPLATITYTSVVLVVSIQITLSITAMSSDKSS